jgi:2-phospho-L-lactate guanylyltransferase
MGVGTEQLQTTAILPIKRLGAAHGRLAGVLKQKERSKLAEAMFLDLLTKIRRSQTIGTALVVTSDKWVARHARWLGHSVLEQAGDLGHSRAAAAGVRAAIADGAQRVAMLPADCPLLDPRELDDRLGNTPRAALIVPDRHGTGTNALVLTPPDAFEPAFGPDSCYRHVSRARAAGFGFAVEEIPSLALDLDTPDDMRELRDALLLDPDPAPRTARVLWELGDRTEPVAAA